MRKIAVATASYHPFTLDDALNGISKAGYKYIELSALSDWMEDVMPDFSFRKICEVKEKLKQHELECIALSGHCSLTDPERMNDFIINIKLASFLGAEVIITAVDEAHGPEGSGDSVEDNLPQTITYFGELCREYGLHLALETHGTKYATGNAIKELLEKVTSDNVSINYDASNVIFYSEIDPYEDLLKCNDKVGYMHLKDKRGDRHVWDFPALGDGYVDFSKLIPMVDPKTTLSMEIQFTPEGPKTVAEVDDAIIRSYQYLQKHEIV